MCNGLIEAGAELEWVYDPDPAKVEAFTARFPGVRVAESEAQVLDDEGLQLVAGAAIPSERGDLGLRVQAHGKHYFTDKTPFTALDQLERAKQSVARTGLKWYVYFSERLHVEGAVMAGKLIDEGRIGRVLQVVNLAPHRLNKPSRPAWFFKRAQYGGILCDIGSHQIEQFLHYAGAKDAKVLHAKVANYANPDYPEFEDFGDATLLADNGATQYMRVDWFNPDGLRAWGDGRLFILGTEGSIEVRKYLDVTRSVSGDHVFLVTQEKEEYIHAAGQTGFPFFGAFLLDCLNGTENSMTQAHAFKAAELCLEAQRVAVHITD
jgi:predicted dehydrogenase